MVVQGARGAEKLFHDATLLGCIEDLVGRREGDGDQFFGDLSRAHAHCLKMIIFVLYYFK